MAIVDMHNHLMPGVDDGARDIEEAHDALHALRECGVHRIVTTPHVQGSLTAHPDQLAARLEELDGGWDALRTGLDNELEALDLRRGVELMLDTPEPDASDPRLRLGGGPSVLVEFPYMTVPPNSAGVISHLRLQGWTPIIAHPERYRGMDDDMAPTSEWRRLGARLQVNGPSLIGRYGDRAGRRARTLLERGWVDLLASDYHARGEPSIAEYRAALERLDAHEQAALLLETNPGRVVDGEQTIPVPPLPRRTGLLDRLKRVFR